MFPELGASRLETKGCAQTVFEDRVLHDDDTGLRDHQHRGKLEHDQKVDYRLPRSSIPLPDFTGHLSHLALLPILAAFRVRRNGILLRILEVSSVWIFPAELRVPNEIDSGGFQSALSGHAE
jgi:hypothetical protein